MKTVVTGGAGFIGSHLVERLLRDSHDVIVVDNLSSGRMENLAGVVDHPGLKVRQVDAADNLDHARGHFGETAGVIGGVSLVNGVLVARWIGEDQLALRNSFAKYWAGLRARIMGYPAALPRLWHV